VSTLPGDTTLLEGQSPRSPLEGHVLREVLSVFLAATLWLDGGLSAKAETDKSLAAPRGSASQKPSLKEQILQIPAAAQVEVRLLNKERFRGRLGEVSDDGFVVQIARGNRIETRVVAFGDVKSLKQIRNQHTFQHIFIGVAMTVGLLLAVGFAIDAARGGD